MTKDNPPLSDTELTRFENFAQGNQHEPDGSQSQWADYTLRLITELRQRREQVSEGSLDRIARFLQMEFRHSFTNASREDIARVIAAALTVEPQKEVK